MDIYRVETATQTTILCVWVAVFLLDAVNFTISSL